MPVTNRFSDYTFTIPAGQSMPSVGRDTGGGIQPSEIFMPADWTTAFLTIYTSDGSDNYQPKTDSDGNLYVLAVSAGKNCDIDPRYLWGSRYVKFVSTDVNGNLVNQTADRIIKVNMRPT